MPDECVHEFRMAVRPGFNSYVQGMPGDFTVWHPVMVRYCTKCEYTKKVTL